MKRIYTKGNVEVQNIKIEDILYEYEYGMGIKSKVISLPKETLEGYWEWQNQVESTGKIINYGVNEKYSHYSPNLYDYEAYTVKELIK